MDADPCGAPHFCGASVMWRNGAHLLLSSGEYNKTFHREGAKDAKESKNKKLILV